jgi:hypothetical protein
VLTTDITNDEVALYSQAGARLGAVASADFPEQFQVLEDGRILVTSFDDSGATEYLPESGAGGAGSVVDVGSGSVYLPSNPGRSVVVSGARGVYELPGGSWLVTNGSAVAEYNPNTGALIETKHTGSMRFIEPFYAASGAGGAGGGAP